MGINQRNKGAAGEREFANYLKALGREARRSQQYQGVREVGNSADILTDICGVRVEVKRGYNSEELWTSLVQEWIETARDETPDDESWVIAWRKDRKKWTMIFEVSTEAGPLVVQSCNVADVINHLESLWIALKKEPKESK